MNRSCRTRARRGYLGSARRGAARISVVWMIAVIVMFFVAFGLAVVAFQDQSVALEQKQAAEVREQTERDLAQQASAKHTDLSKAVGFYDTAAATPATDVDAMMAALEEIKATFGAGSDVKTYQDLLPAVRDRYLAINKETAELRTRIKLLESEKTALQTEMGTTVRDKDDAITKLRTELADANQAAADKQKELEDRVASLRERNNENDSESRRIAAEAAAQVRGIQEENQSLLVKLNLQADKLNPIEKAPETPDGKVLEVSGNLAWINIGRLQRVSPGMRFRIVTGTPGSSQVKAWATVTGNVAANMAESLITDVRDPYNPVASGDVVYNPLFDPTGERFAVLAGRFSDPNESELRELLRNMNITVQQELDVNTDFLIVGSELHVDPETQEPLEEALPASELAVYKDAQAQGGITTLPIKDLRAYFRF